MRVTTGRLIRQEAVALGNKLSPFSLALYEFTWKFRFVERYIFLSQFIRDATATRLRGPNDFSFFSSLLISSIGRQSFYYFPTFGSTTAPLCLYIHVHVRVFYKQISVSGRGEKGNPAAIPFGLPLGAVLKTFDGAKTWGYVYGR